MRRADFLSLGANSRCRDIAVNHAYMPTCLRGLRCLREIGKLAQFLIAQDTYYSLRKLSVIKFHGHSNDRHLAFHCFLRNESNFVKTHDPPSPTVFSSRPPTSIRHGYCRRQRSLPRSTVSNSERRNDRDHCSTDILEWNPRSGESSEDRRVDIVQTIPPKLVKRMRRKQSGAEPIMQIITFRRPS